MDQPSLPLIAFYTFLISVLLSGNLFSQNASIKNTVYLADSTKNQLASWKKQDSLIQWTTTLKSQSQTLRSTNEISGAIALLTIAIDETWRTAETVAEIKLMGWVYVNRAYLYDQKYGDYLAAKNDYLNALNYFAQIDYTDFYVARYLFQPLGNIYTRLGENEQAIVMLTEFKRICSEQQQYEALMNAHNDLGRAYMNKDDYAKAILLFEAGKAVNTTDFYNVGLLESSQAEAELYAGRYDEGITTATLSLNHLQQALDQIQPADFRYQACEQYQIGAEMILGELLLKKNKLDASLRAYTNALTTMRRLYDGKHRRTAKILIGLGRCYAEFNAPEKSIESYQQALVSSILGFDNDAIDKNPPNQVLYADVVIGEALVGKARMAHTLFKISGKKKWLALSLDTYLTYFNWVKNLRAEQLNTRSKLNLSTEIHAVGEETLTVLFALQNHTKDANLPQLALQVMEYTKGILLAENNARTLLNTQSDTLQRGLLQLNQLKMQRSIFQIDLNEQKKLENTIETNRLTKRIEEIDRTILVTDFKLRKSSPAYDHHILNNPDSIDFEKLHLYLYDKNTALYAFFLGEENLFCVRSTDSTFQFEALDLKTFKKTAPAFQQQLMKPANANPKTYSELAYALYTVLFPSTTKKTPPNWLILPDGDLNLIPFEALVNHSDQQSSSFKKMSYLVHEKTIHYAPSLKFILQQRNANTLYKKTYLGIAPVFANTEKLQHLPHSEQEIKTANALFDGDVFINGNASKSTFIKNAANYQVIHLSTHAGVGSGIANDGWIAFQSDTTTEKLRTPELLQLNLSARLVVLNGCETGVGELFKGEGMLSMARGFIEAGAESTLTNLWRVNHSSNARLMEAFYNQLQQAITPAIALQQAKIDYLTADDIDDIGAHPYYWAASVLIGTNHALTLPKASKSYVMYLIISLVVGSILFFIFFKRKRH